MSIKPSVGRTVHYVSRGSADGAFPSACRAAVVTEVAGPDSDACYEESVGLCVLNPAGIFFDSPVDHDEATKRGGTWHWPERVGED